MNTPTDAVVLAVGGDGYDAALAFAVAEARRSGRPLHLVHVLELPAGEAYAGVYGGMLEAAQTTLAEATERAEELVAGDVPVTGELFDNGWVVDDLVRRTHGASLLVLQHRTMGRIKRAFVGSMVHSVAGRSAVPVVSVPEGWEPAEAAHRGITAAVQDPVEATALLEVAFEEARTRGADLQVLHAWWLASGYDAVVVDQTLRSEWNERSRAELAPVLAPLKAEYPEVTVTVEVRHAPPVEALLDAAEQSDLLVLGRRHHLLPFGSHLGPVTRGTIDHAVCPVLITPELLVEAHAEEPLSSSAGELASTPA